MRYMLMMHSEESAWNQLPAAEQQRIVDGHNALMQELESRKKYIFSGRLDSSDRARTVRRRGDGKSVVTDGPFAETKEVMGGFYVIEAASIDEAVDWAKRIPAGFITTEVRPLWQPS